MYIMHYEVYDNKPLPSLNDNENHWAEHSDFMEDFIAQPTGKK